MSGMDMNSPANVVNAVVLIFTLVSGLVVFLRLFMRGFLQRTASYEDGWIAIAMTFSVGLTVAIAVQIHNGLGAHMALLGPEQQVTSLKAFWASIWLYNFALTTTKLSILYQYLRVFSGRRFGMLCYAMMAFVAIYGSWTLFGSIFFCSPVSFFWDKNILFGTCLNQATVWFLNAGVNIAQDIILLIMPMPMIHALNLSHRMRRVLYVIFALGGFVCLASTIRLISLVRIANSTDPTFDNANAAMFSSIEINFGIICACLPALRPLLSTMLPSFFASSQPFHHLRDEEQGKHMRYPTASSFTYVPGSAKRSYHSRTGSNSTRTHSPRYGHSRSASKGSSSASHKGSETELGAIQKPQAGFMPSPHRTEASIPADALGIVGYPGLRFHPLRMSPANSSMPSLPSLPERLATFSPMTPAHQSPHQSRAQRYPPRTPVHKPLPITPFPIMPGA